MSLSSNSIIHFTNKKQALKGILVDNFHIKYCEENILIDTSDLTYVAPMVSFCDIPLSEVKHHIEKYGSYGIGLTKKWAERMGLNPVLYFEKNSDLSKTYIDVMKKYGNSKEIEDHKTLLNTLRYIKNYQNDLKRRGKTIPNYRFSDEREWRYVPDYNHSDYEMLLTKGEYDTDAKKKTYNDTISHLRLEFEPNDIKYIIIKNESEISEFMNLLKSAKGKTYSHHDVERLMTRIITVEQIMSDF